MRRVLLSPNKAIVTASLNGVLTDPTKFSVPLTPVQLAQAAKEAYDEGATVVHVHFRDQRPGKGHLPTWDPSLAAEVAKAIRERCPGLLLNFTTGTFGTEQGVFSGGELGPTRGPLSCLEAGKPEMAALNSGSLNYLKATAEGSWAWKPLLFDNPVSKITEMLNGMKKLGVTPECECFDTGIVRSISMFESVGLIDKESPLFVSFVMGVASGMPANPKWLPLLIDELPTNATWQCIAIGRHETVWPLLRKACELGGNVRTGLEDHFYLPNGERATSSGQLVKALVKMLRETGREPATVREARMAILGK